MDREVLDMIKQFIAIVRQNQSWLILATSFFLGGFILMFFGLRQNPDLLSMLQETSLPLLQELSEQVFGGHPLRGVAILFLNNLRASLQVILMGLLLGIAPLLSAIGNGAILGMVSFGLAQEGIAPLPYLLAGILPHGILELPAFLLSVAFGLKLGYHVIFPMPGLRRKETLSHIFREISGALPVLFVMLVAAAFIEVFVTPALFLLFFPQ
jgi:stage II sporulation protein M